MSGRTRRGAGLFLVLLLGLSACSTAGSDGAATTAPEGSGQPSSSPAATTDPAAPGDGAGASEETVAPQGALELTQQEEAFVAAVEVPADVYPGAVLEAGYEACLRIEQTAAADESILREALAAGEIPDAAEAIRTLCPQFEQYLPTAGDRS